MSWTQTNFLENKLTEYYKSRAGQRDRSKLSASDTGCMLHRQLKLWKIQPDREQSLDESMTFDFGNMIHWFLQKRLQDMDILEIKEMELEDELTIGHADALVREGELLVPYEFKSIKDYGLDRILKEGQPQENHVKQLIGGYFRLMKKMNIKGLADYGKVVYIAKCFDDSHRKMLSRNKEIAEGKTILRFAEFRGDYDEEIAAQVEQENQLVWESYKGHKPLKCSEWDKVYHRDSKYNNYLSWCTGSIEDNTERLYKELKLEVV